MHKITTLLLLTACLSVTAVMAAAAAGGAGVADHVVAQPVLMDLSRPESREAAVVALTDDANKVILSGDITPVLEDARLRDLQRIPSLAGIATWDSCDYIIRVLRGLSADPRIDVAQITNLSLSAFVDEEKPERAVGAIKCIALFPNIKVLNLNAFRLGRYEESVRALIDVLPKLTHLKVLKLSAMDLDKLNRDSARALFRNIPASTEALDLSKNGFTPEIKAAFMAEISRLNALQFVDVSLNYFYKEEIATLRGILPSGCEIKE